jgi:hypothetical protein
MTCRHFHGRRWIRQAESGNPLAAKVSSQQRVFFVHEADFSGIVWYLQSIEEGPALLPVANTQTGRSRRLHAISKQLTNRGRVLEYGDGPAQAIVE